jgi:Fe-S cluster assembly scaffold protein SufB
MAATNTAPRTASNLVSHCMLQEGGFQVPKFGVISAIDAEKHKATMTMQPQGLVVEFESGTYVIPYAHIRQMTVML